MSSYNPYTLSGKRILITGASSGIGRATAIECSRLGATLVITARNEERLNETLSLLSGDEHVAIIADVSNSDDVDRLVKQLPQLDGFVCNAGITLRKPVSYINREELTGLFDVNVFACFALTKSIMRAKKMNRNGSLVFLSSMAARQVTPGNAMYAASKAAVESFSRSCAIEYASKGIRSNAVLPGMIETPLVTGGMLSPEDIKRDKEHYMLKRYGRPEEVAWAIAYLLSDVSAWVTSTSLKMNGGGRILKDKK